LSDCTSIPLGAEPFYARTMTRGLLLVVTLLAAAWVVPGVPPVVSCPCDHRRPGGLEGRVCGLCRTAAEGESEFYVLKDINPRKPNRHLILPRAHDTDLQGPSSLSPDERARYWRAAIEKARELHGDGWGLAANGHFFRTQCHAHIHIGPLSPQLEHDDGELFDDPTEFPNVGVESGIWVHQRGERYCVHLDRDLAEVVLVR